MAILTRATNPKIFDFVVYGVRMEAKVSGYILHNHFLKVVIFAGGCQLDFLKKDTLRVHLHTHTGEKLCACPFCGKVNPNYKNRYDAFKGAFFCSQQKYIDHILRLYLNPNHI